MSRSAGYGQFCLLGYKPYSLLKEKNGLAPFATCFLLVFGLSHSSVLMMEVIYSSEAPVGFQRATWCCIPEVRTHPMPHGSSFQSNKPGLHNRRNKITKWQEISSSRVTEKLIAALLGNKFLFIELLSAVRWISGEFRLGMNLPAILFKAVLRVYFLQVYTAERLVLICCAPFTGLCTVGCCVLVFLFLN
jgi:hypothetical protein